ncbi:thioredoxin family protein [Flavobacteriaceae sp. LMIT009]
MKRTVIFLSILFCAQIMISQNINQTVKGTNGKLKLLGKIDKKGLTEEPFNDWFEQNYEAYLVNTRLVKTYKNQIEDYKVKVFLGTWCGDSKREVPRFYKVLESVKFPKDQLEVIAVDRTADAYKQSPTGEEKGLNIHRVPTFIFYKDGKEVNRIVESPKTTFELDIKAILEGKYTTNYMAAHYLEGLIKANSINSLLEMEDELVLRLSDFVKGSRELNTFGYVKLKSGAIKEAIYIFDLNAKLFPYKTNVYDSLGEAYFESKNYESALTNYAKVLSLEPKNENAQEMISRITAEMSK